MKLKDDRSSPPPEGFVFYFLNDRGVTQKVAPANSVKDLLSKARLMMRNQGVQPPQDLEDIIQHQLCARMDDPKEHCWMGGVGDTIHVKWVQPFLKASQLKLDKVASVDGRASAIQRLSSAVARSVVKVIKKVKSCTTCGGTKVYDQHDKYGNRGRAGLLNQMNKP